MNPVCSTPVADGPLNTTPSTFDVVLAWSHWASVPDCAASAAARTAGRRVFGAGLNLTAASHVIHFDRWWNPAVANQATDRAFRIGQRKNVLVHKFVTSGSVEEKIDQMIVEKRQLANELLSGGSEVDLTALKDDELLNLVRLDIRRAAM